VSVNNSLQRKAFTLIELLIVIVIVGVVYTLAISSFDRLKEKESTLTLETLKTYLNDLNHTKSAKILCLEDCNLCDIFVDDIYLKSLEDFLDDSVKIYRYDSLYGYVVKEPEVFFNTEDVDVDVCFSYEIQKNGIGDQIVVEYKEKVYDFTPYFENTAVYRSISEITEVKEDMQSGVR